MARKKTKATVVRRTRTRPVAPADNRAAKYRLEYCDIHSIAPYAANPRDNEKAVASIANSIKLVGFIVPVVLDKNNVIVAGHTRVLAAQLLNLSDVPVIRAENLTDAQVKAFRLIDNKSAELSTWNFDLLATEVQGLANTGIHLSDFGWDRESLDCLTDTVSADCLDTTGLVDEDNRARLDAAERRAPQTSRFVLGEFVFFIPASEYRTWADGIRALHDFNETEIIADIKRRLRILT